ncbi:hypothetical protein SNE40_018278 [Patella caerulea]|uniref:Uncharacterized protein n=1 Tax=Patella caerulea TaxID=87958 RepID=A0AAN8PAL6_PATCE
MKIISFASYKKRKKSEIEKQMMLEIQEIEKKTEMYPNHISLYEQLQNLNSKLEEHRKKKTEGIIVRSRAKWTEEGERSTSYFLNLEKRNYTNKSIQEIDTELLGKVSDQSEILTQVKLFYEQLYKSNQDVDLENTKINFETVLEKKIIKRN